jgi:oxygen-independent coproporphyrinogen-3 oxidase
MSATATVSTVSAEELAALATRGPRYTSYPPAPHFGAEVDESVVGQQLAALDPARRDEGISLYTHIPFCTRLCWYCGCNVKITRDKARGAGYVDVLLQEIALYAERLPGWPLAELSLGGGSPNFLDVATMERLVSGVREHFSPRDDAVLGIELMPRETSREQVQALAALGFGRLSVGVQDFNPVVQETINRHQTREQTADLIRHARDAGFTSAGIDLVYGLPGQTPESFASTLETILEIAPDRLALFGYAHLPHVLKHQKLVEREPIPGLGERAALLTTAIEMLTGGGYVRVGFDHFARPGDPLAQAVAHKELHRNFQGFTVPKGGPLLACGVTGISDVGTAYWQNVSDLDAWKKRVQSGHLPIARGIVLSEDDIIRRDLIYRLMCDSEVRFADIETRHGVDFRSYFDTELGELRSPELQRLAETNEDEGWIRPTPLGFELIRNLCMTFDPYLRGKAPSGSTTI